MISPSASSRRVGYPVASTSLDMRPAVACSSPVISPYRPRTERSGAEGAGRETRRSSPWIRLAATVALAACGESQPIAIAATVITRGRAGNDRKDLRFRKETAHRGDPDAVGTTRETRVVERRDPAKETAVGSMPSPVCCVVGVARLLPGVSTGFVDGRSVRTEGERPDAPLAAGDLTVPVRALGTV